MVRCAENQKTRLRATQGCSAATASASLAHSLDWSYAVRRPRTRPAEIVGMQHIVMHPGRRLAVGCSPPGYPNQIWFSLWPRGVAPDAFVSPCSGARCEPGDSPLRRTRIPSRPTFSLKGRSLGFGLAPLASHVYTLCRYANIAQRTCARYVMLTLGCRNLNLVSRLNVKPFLYGDVSVIFGIWEALAEYRNLGVRFVPPPPPGRFDYDPPPFSTPNLRD